MFLNSNAVSPTFENNTRSFVKESKYVRKD